MAIESTMTITRVQPDDFLAIAALDRVAWRRNAHSEFIPDGEHVWRIWCEYALTYLARREERVLGAILAFPCVDAENVYCLHKVMVSEDARGKNVGTRLMEVLLAEIDRRGAEIFLTVDPANEAAVRLYTRWGFTERRFVAGFYRSHEDRLVLTRRHPPSVP